MGEREGTHFCWGGGRSSSFGSVGGEEGFGGDGTGSFGLGGGWGTSYWVLNLSRHWEIILNVSPSTVS